RGGFDALDFTTKRARLHELQVMGIGGRLPGNVPEVLLVSVATWGAQREHALVDRVASCPSALRLTPGGFGSRLCVGSCSRSSCCSQEPPNSQRDDAQYAVYSKACLAALCGLHGELQQRNSSNIWNAELNNHKGSKAVSRSAFWSKVTVWEQPALAPSAPMRASAKEPRPSLTAIMAVKTSCSLSTTRTSTSNMRSITAAISS